MLPYTSVSISPPIERPERQRHRNGLSLLELIVSLGILAVLSTIAVSSLDPLADQIRYESTQRLLSELRNASLGDPTARQSNGQRLISGFLADTGRLPMDVSELLSQPVGLIAHSVQAFDSNNDAVNDVFLSSGWRGPYIHLGPGQSDLVDGWGRPFLHGLDSGVFKFSSLGSDNDSVAPEDGYRADISVSIAPTDYLSNVTFRLFAIDDGTGLRIDPSASGSSQLGVLVYSVNGAGGTTGAIEEKMYPIAPGGTFEALLPQTLHGPVAARGIRWLDADLDDELDSSESIELSSYVHYFTVVSGVDLRCEMELR